MLPVVGRQMAVETALSRIDVGRKPIYEEFVKSYFWSCIELLKDMADWMGSTYEEPNV